MTDRRTALDMGQGGEADTAFRVLCLDGGGTRGIYTAAYLNGLAQSFAQRRGVESLDIGTGFDLICGTSTGAIVGAALAAGVPMADVVALYERHGAKIFPRRLPKKAGLALIRDIWSRSALLRQGTTALRAALAERLGTTTLSEVYDRRGIALAFPAVTLANHRSWVFKTPHLPGTNHRDDDISLVDACLASSAAPIFRSIAMLEGTITGATGKQAFVDGGLWANNPVLIGLIDALEATGGARPIEILCLGTVPVVAGQQVAESEIDRGLVGWGFGGLVAGLSIDAQQFAYDQMAQMLARHVRPACEVHRFPAGAAPASLLPYLDLDDSRPEAFAALKQQAGTDANMANSACNDRTNSAGAAICRAFLSSRMRAFAPSVAAG